MNMEKGRYILTLGNAQRNKECLNKETNISKQVNIQNFYF